MDDANLARLLQPPKLGSLPSNLTEWDSACPPGSQFFITDIVIELSPEDPDKFSPIIETFDAKNENGDPLQLKKMSSRRWIANKPIELTDEITFVVRWDSSEQCGYIYITSAELSKGPRDKGASTNRFRQPFTVEDSEPTWIMAYGFCVVPPGQYILYEGEKDPVPRSVNMASFALPAQVVYSYVHTAMPDNDSNKLDLLSICGGYFLRRFQATKSKEDIEKAIKSYELGTQLVPEDDDRLRHFLHNTGVSYLHRFHEYGELNDLNEAIAALEPAVHSMSDDRPGKWACINDLAIALQDRYQSKGNIADISDATMVQKKAIQLIPEGDYRLPALLNNLGNMFVSRSMATANVSDISEAISAHQKALHLTPDGEESMARYSTGLGNAYEKRFTFDSKGDITDITLAILYHRKAVESTPQGHENLPVMLNNVMGSFLSRYARTRDIADLNEAIIAEQQAIKVTPAGHPSRHMWLSNLGILLNYQFEHSNDLADISKAIEMQRTAIKLAPDSHERISSYYSRLAEGLGTRYKAAKDSKDISEAILLLQKALKLTPDGLIKKGDMLVDLGKIFWIQFRDTEDSADIQQAISHFRLAAIYTAGRPSLRLEAARVWTSLFEKYDSSKALDAYGVAIQHLSHVTGIEQSIEKRHQNLSETSDQSVAAAASAISSEEFETALEWLEQGRCIVWRQINTLRSPMDDLRAQDPELADRLRHLSKSIENSESRASLGMIRYNTSLAERITVQDEVTARLKLIQEWEKLLKEVRNIPGFGNFLMPKPCSELLANVPDGMVIVINVHSSRCDALALIAGIDVPVHIPLEGFSYEKAEELRARLRAYLSWHGVRMRDTEAKIKEEPILRGMRPEIVRSDHESVMHEVLHDLWIYVVKPILDGLAISRPAPNPTRIWWCATGPLAFLPIHAAGIYSRDKKTSASCLSDFAISSYTPTIATLLERKDKRGRVKEHDSNKLLMISQPNTPYLPPIPGTTREIRAIEKLLEGTRNDFLCLEGDVASKDRVSEEMEKYGWIHLACHAVQDLKNSLQSGFYLANTQCLELAEIIKKNLLWADFAFLSACQTSTGDEKLAEEAVHLAGGMLAAGYRGVIATMWSIQDRYGPEITASFYSHVLSSAKAAGGTHLDSAIAAPALHATTQQLRATLGDTEASLLVWVPYVHMGF